MTGAFRPHSIRLRKSTERPSISANCSWVIPRCARISLEVAREFLPQRSHLEGISKRQSPVVSLRHHRIMAIGNIKRAFNRLFIVATVAWALYCTVIYPFQQRVKASDHYSEDRRDCYEREVGQPQSELDGCLKLAEEGWKTDVDQWSVKNFYVGAWWLILIAIAGLPLAVYGAIRGIAAVCLWVWHGYKVT